MSPAAKSSKVRCPATALGILRLQLTVLSPTATAVKLGDEAVGALLSCAVQGPNWKWLHDGVYPLCDSDQLTAAALTAAGLPPELAEDWGKVMSYISQLHASKAAGLAPPPCRGTLIVIGYQGAGKSSLVWRLQHPDSAEAMPEIASTDGIATGEDC